jgi:hypothetical protein
MRRVAAYATVLFLLLALILVIGAVVLRPQHRPVGLQPYPALMPGQPVPPHSDLSCLWHYISYSDYFYCYLRYDRRVMVGYVQAEGHIEKIWIDTPGMTIGDLILAWGEPCGVSGGATYQYIHFAGGRAAFVGSPTSPASRVYFVKFAGPDIPGPINQWKGFTSANSRN